jgi:hypothetical protein
MNAVRIKINQKTAFKTIFRNKIEETKTNSNKENGLKN